MDKLELCVWLNGIEKLSAEILRDGNLPDSPKEIVEYLKHKGYINKKHGDKLLQLAANHWAESEIARADADGIFLISWYSRNAYPERLRLIDDPPLVLYVKGHLPDLENSYAIVGTRRCTQYGLEVASALGRDMALAGVPVVSGGAYGIDISSHRGALECDGETVAVLGSALDRPWPKRHVPFFEDMTRRGAVVSEYPFGCGSRAWRFPRRNRIVAGMSRGLIVVEAPFKSGAMITAKMAMEMGRDLWAVPGRIGEGVCEGSNSLILDGASPLVNISDFVEHITGGFGQLELFEPEQLTPEEQAVIACLSYEGGLTLDQIAVRAEISPVLLMQLISGLQVRSLIASDGGGRWRLIPH